MFRNSTPLLLVIALLSLGACASSGGASAGDGANAVLLGERRVDFGADRDVVHVGAVDGTFRALQIHAGKSPMELYDIRVTFGNGKVWSPSTRLRFQKGSWTRRIDLPGKRRVIKKIVFFYRSKQPRTGRALVRVFGVR